MGAFAALGVGLLGTAAGRAAGTLAMGGTQKDVPLSKLEQLAQNELVQSQTFGSNATTQDDLDSTLLGNILSGIDPTRFGDKNLAFEVAPGYTVDNLDDPNLPQNKQIARERANLLNERTQIAQRQANFRQQIRGGNQSTITSLSRKTLLGNQLND